ncbi:MAG: hypothetical protein LBH25_03700 [Fibromonadaceae bacterium]|jgi:hypothetical protein|nr:hypothetical protein [Fibromonadaceae bacterium]
MAKRVFLLLVLFLFCQGPIWAQKGAAREDDRTARKQWEEDQRADEFANSLRRRDWLKDRLIFELGMGTKFPVMGENWFGFGAGVEYITRWHASAFLTAGFIPPIEDPAYPEFTLDGGMGWRLGIAYYMFPKSPIHLSAQVSYGTVYYDHKIEPKDFDKGGRARDLLLCYGYEFDLTISYLTDQWYFLQAIIGMYYIGNGIKDGGDEKGNSGPGLQNPSWYDDPRPGKGITSLVTANPASDYAIPPFGVVFGLGIGFALEDLFPDDTEVRRREREGGRAKQNQLRPPSSSAKKRPAASSRRPSVEEEAPEETPEDEDL